LFPATFVEGKDNRNLLDVSGNQKLSKDEIEELKNELDGKVCFWNGTFNIFLK
jgi:hypothetical protein